MSTDKKTYAWFEVWFDTTTGIPPWPLLIMAPEGTDPEAAMAAGVLGYAPIEISDKSVEVFDTQSRRSVISVATYEEARNFCLEDECGQVTGRMDAEGYNSTEWHLRDLE